MKVSDILPRQTGEGYSASRAVAVLRGAGIAVTDEQADALGRYAALLVEWNARLNLVSRKDEEDLWRNHILHSLAPLILPGLPEDGLWIDIGTGGGLPGVPLAILRPLARFMLCDSIGKKIRAVESMAAALELANVHCLNARIESAAVRDILGREADVVVARAVTELPVLAEWAAPLLRADGPRLLLAWKGGDISAEIAQTRLRRDVSGVVARDLVLPGEPYFVEQEKKIVCVTFS